jgi:DNA-binding GntR family transcriptional regulator
MSVSSLDAFQRRSTTEDVALALRTAIVRGELPQGSKLGEVLLAQRLAVGRGPIREAIRQLVQEGLVEYHVNRGAFVRTLDVDDIRDVYLARDAIEVRAVRVLIDSDVDLGALRAGIDDMRAAIDGVETVTDALVDADISLHRAIVDLAGSPRLARMFSTLAAEISMFLLQNHPPSDTRGWLEEHVVLVDAITARESEAPELMRAHLADSLAVIVDWMR